MNKMKAVRIRSFGGPEVLRVEEVPIPEPTDNEVLIRIKAASVNPIDYKIRSGQFAKPEQLPMILGRDISGTIERCGTQVREWREGDDVFALLPSDRSGYAQYVTLKSNEPVAKPTRLDFEHAAAVPLAAMTAWQGIFDHGALQTGQRVLIHGAAGGVGHFAVQLAKWIGAEVIATAARDDAVFLHDLGADQVIDYKTEKFEGHLRDVDLVFDLIGGETQERSWRVLKRGGKIVSTVAEPDQAMARELGAQGKVFLSEPNAQTLALLSQLIEEGSVRPQVQTTYPLSEAAQAQEHVEHEHARGKTVLIIH